MSEPGSTPTPLVVTLAGLTAVSGLLDAVSYLALGHVFTANMTGNVLLLGFAAAGAAGFSFAASLCALVSFLAGAVVGGVMARRRTEHRSLVLAAMVVEAVLTLTAAVVAAWVTSVGTGWPRFVVIAILAFTVGTRNAAVRRLGVPDMTTTVLTTTLTRLASESTLARGANPHLRNQCASAVSMFSGALVGALLVLHAGASWSLGAATAVVLVAALYFSHQPPLEVAHTSRGPRRGAPRRGPPGRPRGTRPRGTPTRPRRDGGAGR